MQPTTTPTESAAIDPRFGYSGVDGEAPPVKPDHTVSLLIRPREDIPIPEFYFEPTGLAIEPGDTVRFDMSTPHHNVVAYHPVFGYRQRVPDGVAPFSSPMFGAGEYWLYSFETEGVYNVNCAPHELFGMVASIVVGAPTGPGANPVGESPAATPRARPPEFTAGLVLSDPAMSPEHVVEAGSVSWDDLASESKRPLLVPVEEG
jgi:plastocyanin